MNNATAAFVAKVVELVENKTYGPIKLPRAISPKSLSSLRALNWKLCEKGQIECMVSYSKTGGLELVKPTRDNLHTISCNKKERNKVLYKKVVGEDFPELSMRRKVEVVASTITSMHLTSFAITRKTMRELGFLSPEVEQAFAKSVKELGAQGINPLDTIESFV